MPRNDQPREPYSLTRDILAQLLAADASGFEDAEAEPEDFELADRLLEIIDERFDD